MKYLLSILSPIQLVICLFTIQVQGQITEDDISRRFLTFAKHETAATVYSKAKSGDLQPLVSGKSGGDIGGGKVLVCPKTSGKQGLTFSMETLDLFEGRLAGLNPDFGDAVNVSQKIEFVLSRLNRIAPTRAYIYRKWLVDFFKNPGEVQSDEGLYVPNVDDIGISRIPKQCEVVQVIGQRDPILNLNLNSNARYLVNFSIFNLLDDESKVALIFHEIVYREARTYGIRTSESVRALTALLLSKNIDTMTTNEFNLKLRSAKFECLEQSGKLQKCLGFDPQSENDADFFEHQSRTIPINSFGYRNKEIDLFFNGKLIKKLTNGNKIFDIDFYGPVEINTLINAKKNFTYRDSVQLFPSQKAAFNIVGTHHAEYGIYAATSLNNQDGIRRSQPSLRIVRGNQIFVAEKCEFNGGTTTLGSFEDEIFFRESVKKGVLSPNLSSDHKIFEIVCAGFKKYIRGRELLSPVSDDPETYQNGFSLIFVDGNSPIIRPHDRTGQMGPYNLVRLFQEN